jgi:drug/metabolite transporter (DMT)-like permease
VTGAAAGLALLASLAYGSGSALSRTAVRHHTASSVALWVQSVGFLALALAAAVARPNLDTEALAWGVAAGSLAACGVLAFYTAMQNGPISLVAPVAATGVAVPVAGGLLLGEDVGRPALAGLLLVVVGVMVVARSHVAATSATSHSTTGGVQVLASPPGRSQITPVHDNCKTFSFAHPQRMAVVLASLSAAAFGVFYLLLREATAAAHATTRSTEVASTSDYPIEATVLVALAVQGGSLLVTLVLASRHTVRCVAPTRSLFAFALTIGLLDFGGDLALTYAVAVGPIALVGPLGSLDPIVAVIIACLFLGEPITPKRVMGLITCVAGISLVAA